MIPLVINHPNGIKTVINPYHIIKAAHVNDSFTIELVGGHRTEVLPCSYEEGQKLYEVIEFVLRGGDSMRTGLIVLAAENYARALQRDLEAKTQEEAIRTSEEKDRAEIRLKQAVGKVW